MMRLEHQNSTTRQRIALAGDLDQDVVAAGRDTLSIAVEPQFCGDPL
ncbi:MAG: hypothetical protein QM811_24970 [Pirellulales bacterium]